MDIKPDWREVMLKFQSAGISDTKLCDRLYEVGVDTDRSSLSYLRTGRHKSPLYSLGAALMQLSEEIPPRR